ncbi:MAG: PLP-dependent aminotransferase family protein [Kangiellaceae bacterium]|nr:PLP-dependent aminotransferase family protein [Kangiellaceae bacterium]
MWTPNLKQSDDPLYLQIADAMANAIINGELKEGDRLPPQRQLAWHIGVNPSTISKAFQEATKRHLISGEVGRGTYVLAESSEVTLFDLSKQSLKLQIDLSTHVPANLPNDTQLEDTIQTLFKSANNGDNTNRDFMSYLTPETIERLKIACAKWLDLSGYKIPSRFCIPTTCAQNALTVALLASSQSNDTILVDELTFPGMKTVAKQLRLKLHGVEMDEQGMLPDALIKALNSSEASVLVSDPALQNPTGAIMGEKRRKKLTDIIKKRNLLFIEEYVIGTLSGIAPLSTDIQQHSMLINSFAKSVSPGVRFAVLAGRHPLMETISNQTYSTSWHLNPLMAEVAYQWITDGTSQKRRKWQQQEINRRFRLAKSILKSHTSCVQFEHSIPGSHLWLPVTIPANEAAEKCAKLGVKVVPSSSFAVGRRYPNCIRVSLTAAKSMQQLKAGLSIILQADILERRILST